MFKLKALNYTVMLNGSSQWLNINQISFISRDLIIDIGDAGLQS